MTAGTGSARPLARIIAAGAAAALLATAAPGSLIGYFPFDDDFADASGNGNHLVAPGAPAAAPQITTAAGEHRFGGGALDLASSTADAVYLDLEAPLEFAAGDAWSIAFWARNRPGTDGRTGMIAGDLSTANFIWIPGDGVIMGFRFRNAANASADFGGIADDNTFHHWAMVADGSGSVTLYRDKAPLGSMAIESAFVVTSVGHAFNQTAQSMNGQIDELYLFGGALGAAAVAALFDSNTPPDPGLIPTLVHYPFDADFTDASANGNDLTPVGVGAGGALAPTITAAADEHRFGGGACDFASAITDEAYLDFSVPLAFGPTDPWSVAFWARHRPGNDGRTGMIIGDRSNSSDFIWIPRDGAVDGIRVRTVNNATQADYLTPPDGVEPAGDFHHFAVVADGSGNVEVYYDNGSLGSMALDTSISMTSVGQAFNQTTQSMDGQIDELYLYDEAIDAAEVDRLFNGGGIGPAFAITRFSVAGDTLTLRWASSEGAVYAVKYSFDLADWEGEFDDFVVGDAGGETERSFDLGGLPPEAAGEFYVRVERAAGQP